MMTDWYMTPEEGVAFMDALAAERNAIQEQISEARRWLADDGHGFAFTPDRRMCVIRYSVATGDRVEYVVGAADLPLSLSLLVDGVWDGWLV